MSNSSNIIVTRHAGLVAWLAARGVAGDVIPHATPEMVAGKDVYGVLPLHLAALAASVTVVDMPRLAPEQRGQDLTPAEMDSAGATMHTYEVRMVEAPAAEAAPVSIAWNDGLGPRSRVSWLLLVTPQGEWLKFAGENLPGVAIITDRKRGPEGGKWANTTFTLALGAGVRAVPMTQDWDTGRFIPRETVADAVAHLRECVVPATGQLTESEALRGLQEQFPNSYKRVMANDAALQELTRPAGA